MLRTNRMLAKPLTRSFSQYRDAWTFHSKPTIKHIAKYGALPPSLSVEPKDPFDYPLRSRLSVEEFLTNRPKKIAYSLEYEYHLSMHETQGPTDRHVKGMFKVGDLDLTKKQKERLIFLCGDTYNAKTDTVKIRVDGQDNKIDNYKRLEEIMHELYMECLRAP